MRSIVLRDARTSAAMLEKKRQDAALERGDFSAALGARTPSMFRGIALPPADARMHDGVRVWIFE